MQPVVETRSGKLRGRVADGAVEFLGVPYAMPPVGSFRFRPPQPPEPWAGTRDAFESGPAAPQPRRGNLVRLFSGFLQNRIAEDCLYLNVWTPAADAGRRPVMVWLHGGGFLIGSGSSFLYRGHRLVRRGDVVVVTLNYRLGTIGFLDLTSAGVAEDGYPAPANFGLHDQVAALEWVRDNIAAFGGDPDNVTVFGESAGAMSIGSLLGAPRARGLFHRGILQSGAARNVSTPEQAAYRTQRFLYAAGLTGKSPEDLLRALRDLPVDRILDLQHRTMGGSPPRAGWISWQPSVDGDLLTRQPLEAVAAGAAREVPILIGSTREEWKLFTAGTPRLRWMSREDLERRAAGLLQRNELDPGDTREALAAYRRRSPFESYVALRSDEYFRIPAIRLAEAHARYQGATYCYLFDFRAPSMPRALGSCHALDLPFVFGAQRHPVLLPLFLGSRRAARLGRRMQDAWIAFARHGKPEHDGFEQDARRWPAYDEARRATMWLAPTCRVEPAPLDDERRFWQERLAAG